MNADQFLVLAEALRAYARHSERDQNAAHHFVHDMLMRAVRFDQEEPPREDKREAA